LDDGRYIVETKGSLPFRIVDIVEEEPYPIAVVQLLRDPPIMQRTQVRLR
jgi:Lon protease-like protein